MLTHGTKVRRHALAAYFRIEHELDGLGGGANDSIAPRVAGDVENARELFAGTDAPGPATLHRPDPATAEAGCRARAS